LRKEADRRCADVFVRQYGVISRDQALEAGVTPDGLQFRLDTGRWEFALPGVYRLAGVPAFWRQWLQAAVLWAGPSAVVSHRAAAKLWRIEGFSREIVEITVARRVVVPTNDIVAHHSGRLREGDRTAVDRIPVTTVARTLNDLGAVVPTWKVQDAVDFSLRRKLTSHWKLHAVMSAVGGRGCRGVGVLRSLLDDPLQGALAPGSPLERRLISVLAAAGIPEPIRQHPVYDEEGLVGRVDFAWPHFKVGLEADGYDAHSSRRTFKHDRARGNRMTRVGWQLLHATWDDVAAPEALLRALRPFFAKRNGYRAVKLAKNG
jgi:hypothetical protein